MDTENVERIEWRACRRRTLTEHVGVFAGTLARDLRPDIKAFVARRLDAGVTMHNLAWAAVHAGAGATLPERFPD